MSDRAGSSTAASIRQRLLNRIRATGEDATFVWSRYAIERLLYRLSVSEHRADFVLKGAALFLVWLKRLHRPTLDVDFLSFGRDSAARMEEVFRDLCNIEVPPDGLRFDPETVRAAPIREGQHYGGQRIHLVAFLGKARIPLRVDVGFGDVVTPRPEEISYPVLLNLPAPHLRGCPRETVVAEKLHAMVVLGMANSRMKDFYDVHVLASLFAFDGATLAEAIRRTFAARNTDIPADPVALTDAFGRDGAKQTQWRAFLRRSRLEDAPRQLAEVVDALAGFLGPVVQALAGGKPFQRAWTPAGPWQ